MPSEDSIVGMLQGVPIFAGLKKGQLKAISKSARQRSFAKGDAVVREGELGVAFYLILEGSAEVRSGAKFLAKLGRGQFFGEMGLLDQQRRSADVFAVEDSYCLILSAPTFWSLVSTNPKIARGLVQELARRLRATNKALTE